MAFEHHNLPGDIKPHLNVSLYSDPIHSVILPDIKEEIGEHGLVKGIKVEHGTFTSDTKTLQSAVVKIENDDEYPEFESKYNKKEQYMTWEESTCFSRNTENILIGDDVAGPSSSWGAKYEEVDLGMMKMEEDEDTRNESTKAEESKSNEQNPVHNIRRFKHGGKSEKTFDCRKCEKAFSRKDNLDSHIVTQHSNNDEMMNSVTSKIHRCKHCKYATVSITGLTKHMRTHGGTNGKKLEKTFDCIKCEKEFSTKRTLDGHILAFHNSDAEMMKGVTQKINRCKHCKYISISTHEIAEHMMRKHGKTLEKTFDCIRCKKAFSRKSKLDNHIVARHSNNGEMMDSVTNKIHRCKHCKYITVYSSSLTHHMRTHREKQRNL